jgi:hypothetical protein
MSESAAAKDSSTSSTPPAAKDPPQPQPQPQPQTPQEGQSADMAVGQESATIDEHENFEEEPTSELLSKLIKKIYLKAPAIWFKIIWTLIIRYPVHILCFITYQLMLLFEPTKLIVIGVYMFLGIFWGFFPYFLKCIMMYELIGITGSHKLVYAALGLLFWGIGILIYNMSELLS